MDMAPLTKSLTSFVFLLILLSAGFSHPVFADNFKIAVRAHHGIERAISLWQPTVDTLNQEIPEHHFTLVPIVSLNEISGQAKQKIIDFVLTNPSSFVEMKILYQARALVTLNNKRANTAQNQFGSVIFTHARNTDIITINDLKNKSFMAVSKPAFGGWRVAWLEMLEQGFDPTNELKSLQFTKNKTQQEVVFAVLKNKVDAGVVRTDLLERLEAKGKIDMRYFRVLNNKDVPSFPFFLSTALYPEWAFAALNHINEAASKRITQSLMKITQDSDAAKKGNYIGWITSLDYSSVEQLMKKLHVGPYSNNSKDARGLNR